MGDAAEFTVLGKITGDILAVVTGKTVWLLTIFGWSAVKKTHTYRYAVNDLIALTNKILL